MRRHLPVGAALALALALFGSGSARAAVTGNIAGVVTDQATGKALAGVTVTVSGPALQGEQTEFTDSSGRYIITELPPGEYVVRFYYSNVKVERPGVNLDADKTLPVNAAIPTAAAKTATYRIVERAPTVDVGNTQVQTQITSDLVRSTPIQGRTYESVLTLAPGAGTDAVGFSFNGATGPENNFLIDGLNTTNPAFGLLGTPLSLEFIAETEIITGGYNAEYGRATGGVVNVVTKSGSNEFHGGAWLYYSPWMADANRVGHVGEAIASTRKLDHAFDFGFDLGGPIVKDRIWFYAGFAPQFAQDTVTRIIRHRTADNIDPMQTSGTYNGDLDSGASCPSYITGGNGGAICRALSGNASTGPFKTVDSMTGSKSYNVASQLPGQNNGQGVGSNYQWIAKLNFQLNENNTLELHYIGAPSSTDNVGAPSLPGPGSVSGNESSFLYHQENAVHDVGLHFVSKLLDRKLQIDLLGGYHYESSSTSPGTVAGGQSGNLTDLRTMSLADYETDKTDCKRQTLNGGVSFNPCPVTRYSDGGVGFLNDLTNQRISGLLSATYFARLAGTHALKLGIDFEENSYKDHRYYTGGDNGGLFTVIANGQNGINVVERQQFGTVNPDGSISVLGSGFTAETRTFNEAFFLRDSYSVGFVPGLTVNAGIRWELQQVRDVNGQTQISITDNIAPRVGFIYDWTQKGRSKLYASFGRFYESIPLDINDRQFSGEGLLIQDAAPGDKGFCSSISQAGRVNPSSCGYPAPGRVDLNGGTFGAISPVLKGQYSNEVVAGVQYDVGLDLVLGAAYIHRDLGRIIEDISPDGGVNYIVANPGEPTDPGVVSDLKGQINKTSDAVKKAQLQQQLGLYQAVSQFEAPKRDYNALVITANKRLSHNFIVLASYTYSRTLGNYPGLYQASNQQLDPNISTQYDLRELVANRNGPLPNDRPHNLKLTGSYMIPIGMGGVTIGASFNAISGRPIEVLGRHPSYGSDEVFILPRGSGGRTPTVTALDLHLAYGRQIQKGLRVDVYWDIFNLLNQHQVTDVDDQYSVDKVLPIVNGTTADLANLKTTSGTQPHLNPNYGQATAYQLPMSMRFGLRLSF